MITGKFRTGDWVWFTKQGTRFYGRVIWTDQVTADVEVWVKRNEVHNVRIGRLHKDNT